MTLTRRGFLRLAGGAALLNVLPCGCRREPSTRPYRPRLRLGVAARATGHERGGHGRAARLQAIVARIDALMSPYRAPTPNWPASMPPDQPSCRRKPGWSHARRWRWRMKAMGRSTPRWRRSADATASGRSQYRPPGRRAGIAMCASPDTVLETASPDLSLDLCGVAKGYALDEIVRALDGLDFLVELGGEVAARGRHPSRRPWRVQVWNGRERARFSVSSTPTGARSPRPVTRRTAMPLADGAMLMLWTRARARL